MKNSRRSRPSVFCPFILDPDLGAVVVRGGCTLLSMAASGPAAPNHPPVLRTAATALFLLTTLNLFNFIDRYVLPGVQPLIKREFHIDDAQTGLLTSAFFFTYMLIAPLTGWLGDHLPRKPLIIAGALVPTADIMSMIVFAAPMVVLYFVSIAVAFLVHPKHRAERAQKELES